MAEWMENVEKAISRIMADKVYTSAEFKRERDNFHALCKDLEREEIKRWLKQILEILMAERSKEERGDQSKKLEGLIVKHEELIPTVLKTQVKVDLYWKCYAYGDELKPHVEFLDGIMLSSTRDIAPSCLENVDELIERQEKSLSQLDSKRNVVTDLIAKGKVILQNPDKPKFLEGNVKRIQDGWEDTKQKAQDRLQLLNETKEAFIGYAENSETVANEFDIAEEEIKAVEEKLEVLGRFKNTVQVIVDLVNNLTAFDNSLKAIDAWKDASTAELKDIRESSGGMLPEDRVARTMDLQEDIAAKLEILKANAATELELLPQGDNIPAEAKIKTECDKFSNDVKYWAEYRTGIKEFNPWLAG